MCPLIKSHIFLHQFAPSKYQALQQACSRLVETGLVKPDYFYGMYRRELQASTYLDHGIAVPHGIPASRDSIHRTGMVMMQFPEGIDWGDNNRVFLVFALAANGREHLKILSHLACALDNRHLCRELATTRQVDRIYESVAGYGSTRPA